MKNKTKTIKVTIRYNEEEVKFMQKKSKEQGFIRIHFGKSICNISAYIRSKSLKA